MGGTGTVTTGPKHSLDGIHILAELDAEHRRRLERSCRWHSYKADEIIIDRDSDSRDVYFVVSGKVRVVNYSYSGREVSYDDIGEGGFFGEMAAIDGEPRSANVVALTDTTVAIVPPEQFFVILREIPDFAFIILKRLVQIIRGSTDRIMDLSTRGAFSRVYSEILRVARPCAKDAGTARIDPAPVHADVASRAGTTRETVARALSGLSRKGIIKRDGDALVVLKLDELEEIVEGAEEA